MYLRNFTFIDTYIDFSSKTKFGNNFKLIDIYKLSDYNYISWVITRFYCWHLYKFHQKNKIW